VAVGVLALEHEKLSHDVVGRGVVDLQAEKDDAVFEELRVRVLTLVAVGRALLEGGQDVPRLRHARGLTGEQCGVREFHCYLLPLPQLLPAASVPPPPVTSDANSRRWSTKPYSRASCAVN